MDIFESVKKLLAIFILIIGVNKFGHAQIGGNTAYQFLNLHPNARIAALGGTAIATVSNDINLASQNPALLQKSMHNQVAYSHLFLFSDIQSGYVGTARHYDSIGTFSAGLHYLSYGNFTRTADNGENLGTFTAGDYSFQLGYAKKLDEHFSVGTQLKLIYSSLEIYKSFAVAMDIGATYHNEEKKLTLSAVASNIGTQITSYTDTKEQLPFNLQVGFAKKLANAPFRFSVIGKHLNTPGKLLYQNNNSPEAQRDLETGEIIPEDLNIGKQLMSHINLSTELLLGQNFYVAVGYNYLRRWEMKLRDFAGGAGFSWGFGFKISKFQLAYGSSSYFIGNSTDHLSFIVNINDLKKTKP